MRLSKEQYDLCKKILSLQYELYHHIMGDDRFNENDEAMIDASINAIITIRDYPEEEA